MEKFLFTSDANQRSFNETESQVSNSSNGSKDHKSKDKKATKPVKRNNFTVAKAKTLVIFDKVEWLATGDGGEVVKREDLFKKCLLKALKEMDDYNEFAFKKDLAKHMAMLLNDRRFHKTCWDAGWSLFDTAQMLAWAKSSVFQQIRDEGIDQVEGFETPGMKVYEFRDMENELKALGFDAYYFKFNPYTNLYKNAGFKRLI